MSAMDHTERYDTRLSSFVQLSKPSGVIHCHGVSVAQRACPAGGGGQMHGTSPQRCRSIGRAPITSSLSPSFAPTRTQ